jgi:hypothetical protein
MTFTNQTLTRSIVKKYSRTDRRRYARRSALPVELNWYDFEVKRILERWQEPSHSCSPTFAPVITSSPVKTAPLRRRTFKRKPSAYVRRSDVDLMSMSDFFHAIKPFVRMNALQRAEASIPHYVEQLRTLADFCPVQLRTLEATRKELTAPFLHKVHEQNPAVFIDIFNTVPIIEAVYHSLHAQDKSTFFQYLSSLIPHLEVYTLTICLDNFRIKRADATPKMTKNIRNQNSKILIQVIDHFNTFTSSNPRPLGFSEQMWSTLTATLTSAQNMCSSLSTDANTFSKEAANSVAQISTDVGRISDKLCEVVDSAIPAIKSMAEVPSFIDEIMNNVRKHSLALALNLKTLLTSTDQSCWMTTLLTITSLLGLNKIVIDKLINFFSTFRQQSGSIKLLATVSVLLGKYSPVKLITGASLFSTVREVKAIEEITELLKDVAAEWGLYESPESQLATSIKTEVAILLSDLIELEAMVINTPSKFLFQKHYQRVSDNYASVIELEKRFIQSKVKGIEGSSVIPELAKLHTQYKTLSTTVENLRRGESRRQEPVAVIFLGEAGIGKSQFAADLINSTGSRKSLLSKYFEDHQFGDKAQWTDMPIPTWQVWNENVSETMDFADGYVGQEIHSTDDIFQSAAENDHQRYINYISPLKFITNQASLESKGRPYTSKLFIGTCNKFPTSSKTIKEIKALQRRFIVVKCRKVGAMPAPGVYDPTFAHLEFDVYKTGVEYANRVVGTVDTKTTSQLLEYICTSLQYKYKMYCEASGLDYTEQASHTNGNTTHHSLDMNEDDVAAIIQKEDKIPYVTDYDQDWHRDTNPLFHHIFLQFKNLPNRSRLSEMQDPKWGNPEFVIQNYKLWIEHSHSFCRRAALAGYYFSYIGNGRRILMTFTFNANNEAVAHISDTFEAIPYFWGNAEYYQRDPIFTDHGLDQYNNKLQRIYSTYGKFSRYIVSQMKRGKTYFTEFCNSPLTSIQALLCTIASWFSEEAIELIFGALSLTLSVVVSTMIASIVMAIYYRMTKFLIGDQTCGPCSSFVNSKWESSVDSMHSKYCKQFCDVGLVYDTHTDSCKQYGKVLIDIKAMECACNGSCDNECVHDVQDKTRTVTQYLALIKTVYGAIPRYFLQHYSKYTVALSEELLEACTLCTDTPCDKHKNLPFSSEDSNNSIQALKKAKFIVENSDVSIKAAKKQVFKLENSDNSVKSQKKQNYRFQSREFEEQIQSDSATYNLIEPMLSIVKRFKRTSPTGMFAEVNGWVYKNYVITPGHIYSTNEHTYEVQLDINDIKRYVPVTLVKYSRDRDIAIWKHDAQIQSTLLDKHLQTNEQLVNNLPNSSSSIMVVPTVVGNSVFPRILCCHSTHFATHKITVQGDDRIYSEVLKIVGAKSIAPGTVSGDCGSPILMCNTKVQTKILGFHILSNGLISYSAVVTREIVDELIACDNHEEEFEAEYVEQEAFVPIYEIIHSHKTQLPVMDVQNLSRTYRETPMYAPSGDIDYVGEYIHNSVAAKGTNLEKHRLFGTFTPLSAPAALSISEVKDTSQLHKNGFGQPDILQTQFDKYSRTFPEIENLDDDLADMVDQLTPYFSAVLKDEDLSPMTEEETLSGQELVTGSMPMDVRTTAGEPFARFGKTQGKKKNAFLKIRLASSGRKMYTFDTSTEHATRLKAVIDNKEMLAAKGFRTMSLWKNCLKDETRPLEKVLIGKTRLFTAAPFDTVYLGRKYFGRFKEAWQKKRLALFHSVGINPMSDEWTDLAQYLKSHGQDFGDADFSSYDGNLRADFMRAAGKIVCDVISKSAPGNETTLNTIWEEFVETFHVTGTNIHLAKHGNPSGNPMTTVVNCIVNLLYHWWCYRKITNKFSLTTFSKEVGYTCFGDDVLYSTNEDITGFTFDKLASWMKVLGQDYTTAAKDSTSSARKDISEIQFLKRRFHYQHGLIYYAPIETDSIEQQFNYTNIGENDIETIRTQIDEACVEAALHGREYYLTFKKAMDSAIWNDDMLRDALHAVPCYLDARAIAEQRIHGSVS